MLVYDSITSKENFRFSLIEDLRFSLVVEWILAFGLSKSLIRKVKNKSPKF